MNATTLRMLTMGIGLGLLVGAGCTSTEAERRSLLAECSFNDECATPLLCAARRCRAPCRSNADCTNGWVCRSAGEEDKFVCYDPTDEGVACLRVSDCTPPYVCGPTRQCIHQCRTDYDCRIAFPYEPAARCILDDHTCDANPFRDASVATDAVDP